MEIRLLLEQEIREFFVEKKVGGLSLDHLVIWQDSQQHGDLSTNVALLTSKKLGMNPIDLANELKMWCEKSSLLKDLEKIEVVAPGFVNFWLKKEFLVENLKKQFLSEKQVLKIGNLPKKRVMVEFAHPNTHKEMHIGHMRTLITGEAIARLFEAVGYDVLRANYQGDIGPQVAKSIWGTQKLLSERKTNLEEAEKLNLTDKARLLGEGYVLGNKEYEANKESIDTLNNEIYASSKEVWDVYQKTRQWSLDYYEDFYKRFNTKFDKLYFESDVAADGKKIVLENVGKVFTLSDGAIIFDGDRYGLHTRVFVTKNGNPTYEGKEIALAKKQFLDFPFDLCVHVVANEQTEYFKVVFKVLELLDDRFVGSEHHLPMGMFQLVGKKISSRSGIILRVDELIDEVKKALREIIVDKALEPKEKEKILETCAIAALKWATLRVGPTQNVAFDLSQSVSLEGDSGIYLLYSFVRAQSVLNKAGKIFKDSFKTDELILNELTSEEVSLLRSIIRFNDVIERAATTMSPNHLCTYLFDLAKKFNNFYNNVPILKKEQSLPNGSGKDVENFRLILTEVIATKFNNGLNLLGIDILKSM